MKRDTGPQQCSRVPAWKPGCWVKIGQNGALTGRVLKVTALTAAVQGPRHSVVWFVHLGDGRSVRAQEVERLAWPAEVEAAEKRTGR